MESGNGYSKRSRGVLWRSLRDGDFEEEDVWAVPKESKDSTFKSGQSIESSDIVVTRHLPSAARMIPTSLSEMSDVGTCCSTSTTPDDGDNGGVKHQQSAPVNIPQWSNVNTKTRNGSCHHDDEDDDDDGDGDGRDSDDDDEYNAKFPPHEIIARRLARNQISSFSVFEGVGRKLKGRDLRKVRNAVLTKTGFLE